MEELKERRRSRKGRHKARSECPGPVPMLEPHVGNPDNVGVELAEDAAKAWERELVAQLMEAGQTNSETHVDIEHMMETELHILSVSDGADLVATVSGHDTTELVQDAVEIPQASAPALDHTVEYLPFESLSIKDCKNRPEHNGLFNSSYVNGEFELNNEFVEMFKQSQLADQSCNPLYTLLLCYERCRGRLRALDEQLQLLRKNTSELGTDVWIVEKVLVTEHGECQDGNPVDAGELSETAHFCSKAHDELKSVLDSFRDEVIGARTMETMNDEQARQEIIALLVKCGCAIRAMEPTVHQQPPKLVATEVVPNTNRQMLDKLRSYIGVLFHFVRRGECNDQQFRSDLREWTRDSVALLLRCATWHDHMFILHNVLRCPPNISPWLATLVQVPDPPPSHSSDDWLPNHVEHAVAVLGVLLTPIKDRTLFLPQLVESESWVVLDVEGDGENPIDVAEDDLVKILQQVPFKLIFQKMLKIDDDGSVRLYRWNHENIKELFAFATYVLGLLHTGIKTYSLERYKQFAKRLGCLVTGMLNHITDLWELLKTSPSIEASGHLCLVSLSEAYDTLVQSATLAVYSSQGIGLWQVFTQMPFHLISQAQLWRLFYILHQPFTSDLHSVIPLTEEWALELGMRQETIFQYLDELIASVPSDESFYLLSTFARLFHVSASWERLLATAILKDMFMMGFVSASNKDNCMKTCRTLLANMLSEYPTYMSDLLLLVSANVGSLDTTWRSLYSMMPLRRWVPSPLDLDLLLSWLVNRHILTMESAVAQYLLTQLNYSGSHVDRDSQIRILLANVEAVIKFAPEPVVGAPAGYLLPKVANYVRNPKNEAAFTRWAWDLLLQLRLHSMDVEGQSMSSTIHVPFHPPHEFPDLHDNAPFKVLSDGVLSGQCIASYAALLITSWGNSAEQTTRKGFALLDTMAKKAKYTAVLSVVQFTVPLFIQQQELLISSNELTSVLLELLQADKSKSSLTAQLTGTTDFPGLVLRQLGAVIGYHLLNFRHYGVFDATCLAVLWLQVLMKVPHWHLDNRCIYLIDIVAMYAQTYEPTLNALKDILQTHYLLTTQETLNTESQELKPGKPYTLLGWLRNKQQTASLLQTPLCSYNTWYAALVTAVEESSQRTLWERLGALVELKEKCSKATLDAAMEDSGVSVSMQDLAIYSWANLSLEIPVDHPLLMYVWEQFFAMYLARITVTSPFQPPHLACIGWKFFEDNSIIDKMKRRLVEVKDYLAQLATNVTSSQDLHDPMLVNKKLRCIDAYLSWLAEEQLRDAYLTLEQLPAIFDPPRLARLFNNSCSNMHMELLNFNQVLSPLQETVTQWMRILGRDKMVEVEKPPCGPRLTATESNYAVVEKLLARLNMYDVPCAPPPVNERFLEPCLALSAINAFNAALTRGVPGDKDGTRRIPLEEYREQRDELVITVQEALVKLTAAAQKYIDSSANLEALDGSYVEGIKDLYQNISREHVKVSTCSSSPQSRGSYFSRPHNESCAGGATLRLVVSAAVKRPTVVHFLETNRSDYDRLLSLLWEPVSLDTCLAVLDIRHIFTNTCSPIASNMADIYYQLGVELFFQLYSKFTFVLAKYPPTNAALTSALDQLAQAYISGNEYQCKRLLTALLSENKLVPQLALHFQPHLSPPFMFVQLYELMVSAVAHIGIAAHTDSFVLLLSKFNLVSFLEKEPNLMQRGSVIKSIFTALRSIGRIPPAEMQPVCKLFIEHLMLLMMYDFPQHFGEILNQLLNATRDKRASVALWNHFLQTLTGNNKIHTKLAMKRLVSELRLFATNQTLFTYKLLVAAVKTLGDYYQAERRRIGLSVGLYEQYDMYIDPLTILLGLVGECLIIASVQHEPGSLADDLCLKLCAHLGHMYAPWMATLYPSGELSAGDFAELDCARRESGLYRQPWSHQQTHLGSHVTGMFCQGIVFILETLPGCRSILGRVWSLYTTQFTQPEYISCTLQEHLRQMPWHKMAPRLMDMECMANVVTYSKASHSLLGSIFLEIQWAPCVEDLMLCWPGETSTRYMTCYLKMLIRLAQEPTVRQKGKTPAVIATSRNFRYTGLDPVAFSQILGWWVNSDPRVVLILGECYTNPIDAQIYELLILVAGFKYIGNNWYPHLLDNQVLFLRACLKMMTQTADKFRKKFSDYQHLYEAFTQRSLNWILDPRCSTNFSDLADGHYTEILLAEYFYVINHKYALLGKEVVGTMVKWLANQTTNSTPAMGVITHATRLTAHETAGQLLEAALTQYCSLPDHLWQSLSWNHIDRWFTPSRALAAMESALIEKGYILTVYALLYKRFIKCTAHPPNVDLEGALLISVVDLVHKVRPTVPTEWKLPYLWGMALNLIVRQLPVKREFAEKMLLTLLALFQKWAEVRTGGWTLLFTFGKQKHFISEKCRLICHTMAAFILAQLPDGGSDERAVRTTADCQGSVMQLIEIATPESPRCCKPTAAARKSLEDLEQLVRNQDYCFLRPLVVLAASLVRDSNNSLHNIGQVLETLTKALYTDRFVCLLPDITV